MYNSVRVGDHSRNIWVVFPSGVDTTDVEKDSRPNFMQHFDKKDEHKKKIGKKQDPNGPHDISYYFPDIPEGMDFRDFVSVLANETDHLL